MHPKSLVPIIIYDTSIQWCAYTTGLASYLWFTGFSKFLLWACPHIFAISDITSICHIQASIQHLSEKEGNWVYTLIVAMLNHSEGTYVQNLGAMYWISTVCNSSQLHAQCQIRRYCYRSTLWFFNRSRKCLLSNRRASGSYILVLHHAWTALGYV